MERQHDHHCIFKTTRENWRITRVSRPMIVCECADGCCDAAVDMRTLNVDRYCADALMWDVAVAARVERRAIPAVPISAGVN